MVHPVIDAPLLPRERAVHAIRAFRAEPGRGRRRARAEGGNESVIGRVGDVAESGAQNHVNPLGPVTSDFFHFFQAPGPQRTLR